MAMKIRTEPEQFPLLYELPSVQKPNDVSAQKKCKHCGDRIPLARQTATAEEVFGFCCEGCSAVFSFLKARGFSEQYYGLKNEIPQTFKPRIQSDEDYSALDAPPFREKSRQSSTLEFFIEGIHCSACVWLLERLPEMGTAIENARLDLGRSSLRVTVGREGKFEEVAKLLLSLGYRPHPVLSDSDHVKKIHEEDRKTLRRIGVAAFSAMNVMIYSISLYTGVDGKYAVLFRALSLLVAFPALTYSAWPFYRSAFASLRSRRISIDLPIVIAFIFGFLESLRQAYSGTNLLYLDSLTSLVFLMLLSRYVLSRLERAELSKSGLLQVLLPSRILRKKESDWESVRADLIAEGDTVLLKGGARVPADGEIIFGSGEVDLSILTGESKPLSVSNGDKVYAGSVFSSGEVQVRIQAKGSDTRIGQIQRRLENLVPKENARTVRSDSWAQIFLAVVIGLSAVLAIGLGFENLAEAFRRSLSLLIIACPCALALATPLTLARAYRLAAHQGLLLRNPEVLDRVLGIKHVIFDKTGTLTSGEPRVLVWHWEQEFSAPERARLESIAYSMEVKSRHPYGRAIVRHLENREGVRFLKDLPVRERIGSGVSVLLDAIEYRLGRGESMGQSAFGGVAFFRGGEVLARVTMENELRPEVSEVVQKLKQRRLTLEILSGDSEENTKKVSHKSGITTFSAGLSPEEKKSALERYTEPTLVIGDGINDALMVKSADVGVAFNRGDGLSIESSLSSSDVALTQSDLRGVCRLFEIAERYRSTLTRNAVFSALYNLIGASIAVAGFIHPLVAAIAMPLSALTVFMSTLYGLRIPKERVMS